MLNTKQGPGFKKNYQIHLKSQSGPINVLLVNKDAESDKPVVVQVPPPAPPGTDSQNQNPVPTAAAAVATDSKGTRGKVSVVGEETWSCLGGVLDVWRIPD